MSVSAGRRPVRERGPAAERRVPVITFVRESIDELRKVVWPTGQELYRYTAVVIVFTAILALFIYIVDQSLEQGLRALLRRLTAR